mmetsp:Transcript_1518/g.4643  ORF Transcript_1518/g.4643 Transcript_1518/m.4643 type:complete len:234 (-) Transcript_1518:328-1029(-)
MICATSRSRLNFSSRWTFSRSASNSAAVLPSRAATRCFSRRANSARCSSACCSSAAILSLAQASSVRALRSFESTSAVLLATVLSACEMLASRSRTRSSSTLRSASAFLRWSARSSRACLASSSDRAIASLASALAFRSASSSFSSLAILDLSSLTSPLTIVRPVKLITWRLSVAFSFFSASSWSSSSVTRGPPPELLGRELLAVASCSDLRLFSCSRSICSNKYVLFFSSSV